jgi:enoyl-CoA hydratase
MTTLDPSDYETIGFSRDAGVLTLTLDSGRPYNALTSRLHTELATVFAELRTDPDTSAVVLTGHGSAFCAGADLDWIGDHTPADRDRLFAEGRAIVLDLLELPQPVVAAVEGPAIGFGATLALFADVTFMAANARIGDPHVLVGLAAGDGGAVIWPWLVGAGRAKRYLMTGDVLDGVRAERIGLVEEVTEPGGALASATAFARRLANGNARAIRATKASVNKILRDTANLVLDTSLALEKECMAAPEFPIAVAAMRDRLKRPVS